MQLKHRVVMAPLTRLPLADYDRYTFYTFDGASWFVKSKGDALKNVVITAETKRERLTMDFPGQDKRSIFEPSRIVMEKADGTLIEARNDPEKSFEGQQRETPWDDIHVAYFGSEALWTYLNTPFLYTYEGFEKRGDFLDSSGRRDLAAVKGDVSEYREKPHTRTDILFWT